MMSKVDEQRMLCHTVRCLVRRIADCDIESCSGLSAMASAVVEAKTGFQRNIT